jgi:hypothetical protein
MDARVTVNKNVVVAENPPNAMRCELSLIEHLSNVMWK